MMDQLLVMFGDVKGFLHDNDNIGPAVHIKLLAILNDPAKAACLQIELAAITTGTPLVKANYSLEGDGTLVMKLSVLLSTLSMQPTIQTSEL